MDYQKERYHYNNYIGKLEGARVHVLPTECYVKKAYTPFASALDILNEPPGKVSMDDFMSLKVGKYRDKVDLILDELGRRDEIKRKNLYSIHDDLMGVYEAKFQLDPSHFYEKSPTWSNLFSQELSLKQQIRSELRDMYRDTQRSATDLRDSLLEHKIQNQKMNMFSIEDALD
jgi:hypothetical protein